jgi:hypothetical protein
VLVAQQHLHVLELQLHVVQKPRFVPAILSFPQLLGLRHECQHH